jgi:L-iditol 2-dehydrogenase
VVVLAAPAPALVHSAIGWARDGGAVHLFVGEGEAALPLGELYKRELTLTATYSSSPEDLAEAFGLLRSRAVRVDELCSHRVPLDRLPDAVRLMERREALKVFVEVGR